MTPLGYAAPLRGAPARRDLQLIIPALCVLCYGILALSPDLRLAVPLLVGMTALVVLLLAVTCFLGAQGRLSWSSPLILTVAALIRLFFLFDEPRLSDDLYRYLWDGQQTLAHRNPYAAAPDETAAPTEALAALRQRVNHPRLVTVYLPAAQLLFLGGAALGGVPLSMKALLVVLDLGSCLMILRLLARLGIPSWRATLYAWHPLPVLEIGGSGHIDAGGSFFLLLASLLLLTGRKRGRPWRGGILASLAGGLCFGAAVLVKLFPAAFLPGYVRYLTGKRRWAFLAGLSAGVALLVAPFVPDIANMGATLSTYGLHWEFGSFSFRLLRRLTSSGYAARIVLTALFLVGAASLYAGFGLRGRRATAPPSAEKGLEDLLIACCGVSLLFLLLSPTVHPWYALTLAALLPFSPGPAALALSWAVLLSYRVVISYSLTGLWIEDDLTPLMIALAPLAALLARLLLDRKNHSQ